MLKILRVACFLIISINMALADQQQDAFDQASNDYRNISSNTISSGDLNNQVDPNDYAEDYTDNPEETKYYSDDAALERDGYALSESDPNTKATKDKYSGNALDGLVNPNSPGMQNASNIMQYSYEYSHGISTDKFDCENGKSCRWTTEPKSCEISEDFSTTCTHKPVVEQYYENISNCSHYVISGTTITTVLGADSNGNCQSSIASWTRQGYNSSINLSGSANLTLPKNIENASIVLFASMTKYHGNTSYGISENISSIGTIHLSDNRRAGYTQNYQLLPTNSTDTTYLTSLSGGWATGQGGNNLLYGTFIQYPQRQPQVRVTGWQTSCPFDDMSQCSQTSEVCVAGAETRYFNGIPLYLDCWEYQKTMNCSSGYINTCDQMDQCDPTGQSCLITINGTCTRYQRNYACPLHVCDGKDLTCGSLTNDIEFNDPSPEASLEDFYDAVGSLAAVSAVGNTIKNQDTLEPNIFPGEAQSCGKAGANLYDCCDSGSNIFMHCSEEDQALKKARDKGITIYVGEYCDIPILSIDGTPIGCRVYRKSFCVFPSELDRIVQEQGRQDQLGIGFGEAEHPDCRGMSIEEFEQLDLSTMDFSEIDDSLTISSPDETTLTDQVNDQYNNSDNPPDFNNDDLDQKDKREQPVDDSSIDEYAGKNV
ncbi:conjugal transfer protein TraN [Thiotrichales bacterium 19S11-10]|nr:conjugal transfer protein TraN [Thiotrichales bacterium 19S11-10]